MLQDSICTQSEQQAKQAGLLRTQEFKGYVGDLLERNDFAKQAMAKEDGEGKGAQVAMGATRRSFLDPPPASLVVIPLSLFTITTADLAWL